MWHRKPCVILNNEFVRPFFAIFLVKNDDKSIRLLPSIWSFGKKYTTNTPSVFHVETTWKRRGIHVICLLGRTCTKGLLPVYDQSNANITNSFMKMQICKYSRFIETLR